MKENPVQEDLFQPVGAPQLTPWSSEPPPCSGWWQARVRRFPTHFQPQRRYYDAERKQWSLPVIKEMDDHESLRRRFIPALLGQAAEIEWCGLAQPHPDGYTQEQWDALDAAYGGRA
jgi:hypothetical protein